jgi:hypothetical protein
MLVYLDSVARKIAAELAWDWQSMDERRRQLLRAYAVLARAKGVHVTEEDVHDAWAAWMASKDPEHPDLKPFAELTERKRRSDEPFTRAIRTVAHSSHRGTIGRPGRDRFTPEP